MKMHSLDTAFIHRISAEASASTAVNHPYLQAIRDGDLPNIDMAIKDFAFQYGLYSSKFIRYLSAVIKNLNETKHKRILLGNLTEEQGDTHDIELPDDVLASIRGIPHTKLYQRFQDAVGVDTGYRETTPQSQTAVLWSDQFLQLCEMDECVGIGAIGIGTEFIVSGIYHQILEGLKAHSDLTMTERVFFDLHSQCDEAHAAQMISIAKDLARDSLACERIEYGTRMAISMRTNFWDKMLERAQNFPASASGSIQRLTVV
jgi:pyrroloquinoline quinone (PQQ) biosynthesis protein C